MAAARRRVKLLVNFCKIKALKNRFFLCDGARARPLPGGRRVHQPPQHEVGGGSEKLGAASAGAREQGEKTRDAPGGRTAGAGTTSDTPSPPGGVLPSPTPHEIYTLACAGRRAARL